MTRELLGLHHIGGGGATVLSIMTNISRKTEEAIESAPILFQANPQVIFCQEVPEFSLNVLIDGGEWLALPASIKPVHADQAIIETTAPDIATPAAVGSGKRN